MYIIDKNYPINNSIIIPFSQFRLKITLNIEDKEIKFEN